MILTIVIIILTVIFVNKYLLNNGGKNDLRKVQGPFNLPLLGALYAFDKERFHKSFDKFYDKYKDFYFIKFGQHDCIVLNSPKLIKQVVIEQSDSVFERFHTPSIKRYAQGKSILGCSPDEWKKLRSFIVISFSKNKMGQQVLDKIFHTQYLKFENHIKKLIKSNNNIVTLEPEFKRLTISIIFNFQFGTDLEFTDPLIDSLLVCTEKIIASCQKASDLMPIFEIFTSYKDIDGVVKEMYALVKPFLEKYLKQHDRNNPKCALDHMINCILDQDEPKLITYEHLPHFLMDMFIGGTESTARTMDWFTLMMTNRKEMQDRIRTELLDVGIRLPVLVDKQKYPLLNASIKEIHRLRPIQPIIASRVVNDPIVLKHECSAKGESYTIPVGTLIIPNAHSFNFDPQYHKDPLTFNPNRYIGDNPEILHMTFDIGIRTCPFMSFAIDELFIIFSRLFQSFEFQPIDNTPISEEAFTINSIRPKQWSCQVIERDHK